MDVCRNFITNYQNEVIKFELIAVTQQGCSQKYFYISSILVNVPVVCLIIMHVLEISMFFFRILPVVETKHSSESGGKNPHTIPHAPHGLLKSSEAEVVDTLQRASSEILNIQYKKKSQALMYNGVEY